MIDISNNSKNQQTIAEPVSINGIGLHSGVDVTMKLYPAEADYGIKFIRKDLNKNNIIEAIWSNVTNTKLSTTISNQNGASVSTIEHLMSALSGLHIDNIKIEIDYDAQLLLLSSAKVEVTNFFENVIVNDDDVNIKKNRLLLLKFLCKTFDNYLSFAKIETAK